VKPAPSYCICMVTSSILLLLLLPLLWYLFHDTTFTATGTHDVTCIGCLKACQYVVSNNCNDMILRNMPAAGPCSKVAVTKACMQCANFPGNQCKPDEVAPPVGTPSTCVIWGDPHLMTFDRKRVDFYTPGEYWIVKSSTVNIQGLYRATQATSGLAVLQQIAFGGPFMQGHKLIIGATMASWDGQPVLAGFPSNFQNQLVQAVYDANGGTMQDGRQGKQLHIVHLTLPLSVTVQINRWTEPSEGNYINAKITMSAQPGQDGHCGNFNGNQADDDRLQIRARVGTTGVAQGELLFPIQKTPIGQSNRPDINNCPRPKLETAKAQCKAKEHKFIPSMSCLVDVCFGGPGFAAEAGAEGM